MFHLALLKQETRAIKNPPALFQTVSLGTWVNKGVAVALGTHDGHYGRGAWFRPQVLFGEEELWRPGATPPTPI